MAAVAFEHAVGLPVLVEEQRPSGVRRRAEGIVEVADGIGRVADLQDEAGEGVHVLVGDLVAAAVQAGERHVELLEGGDFVEGPAVGLLAGLAVVLPVSPLPI